MMFLAVRFAMAASQSEEADWAFIDNGELRLGIKKSSGGCIGYLSRSGTNRNVLNHFDRGRLVQQSYYGERDGTVWGKQPWRWNPVQGGDYKGTGAKILELKMEKERIYTKTLPRHWSGCVDLPEVTMEQWIQLTGAVAHVRFKMAYNGTNTHPIQAQEIPALFIEPEYGLLVLYDGAKPWTNGALTRSEPGWPNESRRMTEHWAAYMNHEGFGIGAYVPIASELTCYRYGREGTEKGACSYFAPITRFAIKPGLVFEYEVFLTLGKTREIRSAFSALQKR
jgi:hypothetical protein